ncbi:MAG: TRAFs-binding domain-containing protein [Verrucomicrobiota bacterium]|nr:TRAFs-binding domain-containing protein [Verrucomicrobiota bacterium]
MSEQGGVKIDNLLRSVQSASLAELMSIWRAHAPEEGAGSPRLFRCLGERMLAQGEPLLAYDVISAGLATWPQDVRLRQLQGLSLARSGATERANAILKQLRTEVQPTEETLGMLGRTYKDLALDSTDEQRRAEYLRRAAEIYGEAYRARGGYWTGINAATLNLLIGERETAYGIASKVRERCLKEIAGPSGDSYWELAALGEAALICRDWSEAEKWYARAAKEGRKRFGDLNSSRRNARLILGYWNEDRSWIDKYLRVPSVIVFAGHMIDRPGRKEARFPDEIENEVAAEIQDKINLLQPGFGFSSAACGSDILFLEVMLDRGAEVSIVLPYNEKEFVRHSVEIGPHGRKWGERFDRVLARAARVITASDQHLAIGGVSYEFCNEFLLGLAAIRCRQLDSTLIPLAMWNGQPGDGPGGAASAVGNWRSLGYEPEIVDLTKISHSVAAVDDGRNEEKSGGQRPVLQEFNSRIVAILFADAVGFSKLSEAEVPRFVAYFLGAIAKLSEAFSQSIIANNTWGDGLYFVLDDVDVAGDFALQVAALATLTNWKEKGLRDDLNLRVALHAGPVYEFDDPITGRRSYSGTHVSRAARIEPIVPPGQVYASEAFAALAAARHPRSFTCDYVGQTPMAKGYGTLPIYHVRRGPAVTTSL